MIEIAGPILSALIQGGGSVLSGYMQNEALSEGQKEARELNLASLTEQRRQNRLAERISKEGMALQKNQLSENKRQFNETMAMRKSDTAFSRLENQFGRFNELLNQNEQLKSLVVNRLGNLRG